MDAATKEAEQEAKSKASDDPSAKELEAEARKKEAVRLLKKEASDADITGLCKRIAEGLGYDDISGLVMSREELNQAIISLDDEYYEGKEKETEKLFDIVDKCMDVIIDEE